MGHDALDPFTAFAFVAAASTRLMLHTNILVMAYRNPFLTAKAAATLQVLSGDRLILGVGAGYQKVEFEALGVSGHFSMEFSETVEAASREVLELIESGAAPFDGSWVGWAPPSSWAVPVLHPRWQEEPPTPWSRREWAYPLPYR